MEFLQDKWNIFQGSSFFLNKITNCYLKKKKKGKDLKPKG